MNRIPKDKTHRSMKKKSITVQKRKENKIHIKRNAGLLEKERDFLSLSRASQRKKRTVIWLSHEPSIDYQGLEEETLRSIPWRTWMNSLMGDREKRIRYT